MSLITLDFETYFDNDYTLKKLTTEAYIRDPRFKILCTGLKIDDSQTFTIKPGYSTPLPPIPASGVLCHHAQFDGLILSNHLGLRPRFWFDTLSMARCAFPHEKSHSLENLAKKFDLGHKTVPYEKFKGKTLEELISKNILPELMQGCADDVELTHSLFKKLLPLVPKEELKIIDLTVRMFTEPALRLDRARAAKYMEELQFKQDKLLKSLGVSKTDLASADKFAALLESFGIEPPKKISSRTGKEAYAFAKTDPGFLALCDHEEETVRTLCEARLSSKSTIGETRAGRLLSMSERGALPVYLKYFGAHTGRWSGGDKLNFQNFPRGGELRKSLLAPTGFVLCVTDLSQIECRMLNWLAREKWVLEAFAQGRDLYSEMASKFYGRKITKADKQERFLGKTLELGAGYGVGWRKLQGILALNGMRLTEEQAQAAITAYRTSHPEVVNLWRDADRILRGMVNLPATFEYNWGPMLIKGRSICLPNGVTLDYSNLDHDLKTREYLLRNPKGTTKIYGGKLVENVVQALARVVMSQAMLKIGSIYKIITTSHDEVVYLAPEDEADMALEIGLNLLKTPPAWAVNIPLEAEGGWSHEYSK